MNGLTIIKHNGGAYVDSRKVAECLGKRHDHLLRDIGKYCDTIARRGLPNFGESDFFVQSSYINAQNREMPCYLISKMGCELVANKLTGEKGVLFTAAYVYRFNELEAAERREIEKKAATPQLRAFNAAVRNVLSGFTYTFATPEKVMDFLQGAYQPFGILVAPYGVGECTMTVTDIARYLGLYSRRGLPHGHAVAAIIDRIDVSPENFEIVPFGLVGISVRYDKSVLRAVADWLTANNFPHDIPYLDFEYHVSYNQPLMAQSDQLDFDDDCETEGICTPRGCFGGCDGCPCKGNCDGEF